MYHACVYRGTSLQQTLKQLEQPKFIVSGRWLIFGGFHQQAFHWHQTVKQAFTLASDC